MDMKNQVTCPECKVGVLTIVTDGLVGVPYAPKVQYVNGVNVSRVEWRWESKRFAACNACEFCKCF